MNLIVTTYLAYLTISILLTVWVARTLHRNGRVFLVDVFKREDLADSVNHLLVVGFYLVNLGYVTLALKYGDKPHDLGEAMEFLSTKVGLVAIVLGAMHFFNMYVISKIRHEVMRKRADKPRVAKDDPMDRVMERAGA